MTGTWHGDSPVFGDENWDSPPPGASPVFSTPRLTLVPLEDVLDLLEGLAEAVDLVQGVVEVEAGPARGRKPIAPVQRHGTVVPGADGDAVAVQQLGHVVGVDPVERETDDARLVLRCRPEDPQALDRLQDLVGPAWPAAARAGGWRPCRCG